MRKTVTKGNVFKDIGFTNEEAIAMAMRVDLSVEIAKFIKRKKTHSGKSCCLF